MTPAEKDLNVGAAIMNTMAPTLMAAEAKVGKGDPATRMFMGCACSLAGMMDAAIAGMMDAAIGRENARLVLKAALDSIKEKT